MSWDPDQYAQYRTERNRPFFDLVSQVGAVDPVQVVDLGCGTGELTATLAQRWPQASVLGIDSSPEMMAASYRHTGPRVGFTQSRAQDFSATGVDVLVSNALLQWVPDHQPLLRRWAAELAGGGWLAFSVPSNFDAPSHVMMREVAESYRWRSRLRGVLRHTDAVAGPAAYLDLLARAGLAVTAWQTTYLHLLDGDDPVLEWVRGTGLRPILAVLDADEAAEFTLDYARRLRAAYPRQPYGTVFPFQRTFVVAHKP
jgi:trans-aconitate 2-methyltransferase